MITCTILIYDRMITILFDSSSIYSYVSINIVLDFDVIFDMLDVLFYVSTTARESVVVTHIYHTILFCLWDFRLGLTW